MEPVDEELGKPRPIVGSGPLHTLIHRAAKILRFTPACAWVCKTTEPNRPRRRRHARVMYVDV